MLYACWYNSAWLLSRCPLRLQTSEGLTVAEGSTCHMAHSCGWWVKTSVPHWLTGDFSSSSQGPLHGAAWVSSWGIQENVWQKLQCLLGPSLRSHTAFPQYLSGYTSHPISTWEGLPKACGIMENILETNYDTREEYVISLWLKDTEA